MVVTVLLLYCRFGFARGHEEPAGAWDAAQVVARVDGAAPRPGGTLAPPLHLHVPRRLPLSTPR